MKNKWIRLAVSRDRIMNGNPHHWRCFIDPSLEEIPLKKLVIIGGEVTPINWLTKSQGERDERGVVAWIHLFGDIEVRDGIAHVVLQNPERSR